VTIGPKETEWKFYNFRISTDTLSFLNLPHSGFATPARYLMELFRRICQTENESKPSPKMIFNPLFKLNKVIPLIVLERAKRAMPFVEPIIFSDRKGIPIAYLFPSSFISDDAKFLSLLSTVDATLDRLLLKSLSEEPVNIERIPEVSVRINVLNDFYDGPYFEIYKWVALTAIEALQSQSQNTTLRKDIPFSAIMPYHAGDLLFLSLASQKIKSHITRVIVNKRYLDIVKDTSTNLDPVSLNMPPLNREGIAIPEWQYFEALKGQLPKNSFYYFMRPTRNYDACSYHLIDQFAFALGKDYDKYFHPNSTVIPSKIYKPLSSENSFNILLHFDSGWPLKIYPQSYQEELVNLLNKEKHKVTILDGKYPLPCSLISFQGYHDFITLLHSQHIIVGMDSFPVHYAAHVLGLPTICLFACTQPANSDALPSIHYKFLEKGLNCRPCQAIDRCSRTLKHKCDNFVEPATVAQEINIMLQAVYK
jgi:hypothetical protein